MGNGIELRVVPHYNVWQQQEPTERRKQMKKNITLAMVTCLILMALLIGCNSKAKVNPDQHKDESAEDAAIEEETTEVIETNDKSGDLAEESEVTVEEKGTEGGTDTLTEKIPAYEYPGPELFYSILYQYLIDEYADYYPAADVSIPCPVIVYEDDSDRSDIKIYGNFWIFNYDLNGEILECKSGGSYPGCIHVKSTEAGYEIISADVVADGSEFTESAKEIFGEHYDAFMKKGEDEKYREELRAQIIANYVFDKGLNISSYQDYGWDPVSLPKENIDTFYSIL